MREKKTKIALSLLLAVGLMLSGMDGVAAHVRAAAGKETVKLSETQVSIKKGTKVTLKVITKNIKKIVSTKWSSKNKKIATVSSKGKVTGKKAGKSTVISCQVKYMAKDSKKAKSKKLVCKVKVKKNPTKPAQSPQPSPTADSSHTSGNSALVPGIMPENQVQQNPYLSAEESMIHNDIYNSDVT